MAEEIVQKEDIKYSYGNVIHNQQVINELREQGLITVNDICEIPDGSAVLVRAHGVSSTFYNAAKEKKLKLYDATCPYVGNIHKRVQMMYEEGYKIIIVGSSMHPEVIGINGYCNN